MYIYVGVCIYVYIYAYAYIYICIYACVNIRIHMHQTYRNLVKYLCLLRVHAGVPNPRRGVAVSVRSQGCSGHGNGSGCSQHSL